MPQTTLARYGNRNAAGRRKLHLFTTTARECIAHRNWGGTPDAPALAGHYMAPVEDPSTGDIAVGVFRQAAPAFPVYVSRVPEHAKRYIEHVHNFGRPPI